jgi:hypothetical protein
VSRQASSEPFETTFFLEMHTPQETLRHLHCSRKFPRFQVQVHKMSDESLVDHQDLPSKVCLVDLLLYII